MTITEEEILKALEPLKIFETRLSVDFWGNISQYHYGTGFTRSDSSKKFFAKLYSINCHRDGVRHLGAIMLNLSTEHCIFFARHLDEIKERLAQVSISTTYDFDKDGEIESNLDYPWSNRIFLYTDNLNISRAEVVTTLKDVNLKPVITDNATWDFLIQSKKPDIFLSHDSRDKKELARPLAHSMIKLGLNAWYDEFALKPGDRLSSSIDKGLTECKHAILLITPHFLQNEGWTSVEMSALLTRAVSEKNLLIPIWVGVDKKSVAARSSVLADLFAITDFFDADDLASKIYPIVRRFNTNLR